MAATVDRFGSLDILINNAGITRDNMLYKMGRPDWDAVISTNERGEIRFMNLVARSLTGWADDSAIGQPLPSSFVFDYPSVNALSEAILRLLGLSVAVVTAPKIDRISAIENMSEEEAHRLLLLKLKEHG